MRAGDRKQEIYNWWPYGHKDLELENHTADSEVFDVFNTDDSAPSFSENDSLVVEELSPVQPPEAELVDETRVIV